MKSNKALVKVMPTKPEEPNLAPLVREMLVKLGEDPTRDGLANTPFRVDKALKFLTSGYATDIRAPRRLLADCSPSTQLMASLMLLLPQPLGPTMAAIPSPLKRSSVRSQKLLNPCSSMRFSFSKALTSLGSGESCNYTKRA